MRSECTNQQNYWLLIIGNAHWQHLRAVTRLPVVPAIIALTASDAWCRGQAARETNQKIKHQKLGCTSRASNDQRHHPISLMGCMLCPIQLHVRPPA
jgi:hypothetical protein